MQPSDISCIVQERSLFREMEHNSFEFDRVSFAWPDKPPVLREASFAVPAGGFVLVNGPSGSGKSTMLRLMNRLEEPQAGTISFENTPLADFEPPILRRRVGYLQQMPVVPDLSVREALLLPFTYAASRDLTPPDDGVLGGLLGRVHLGSVALGDRAASLSVGQKQRLCLIRATLTEPDVLLLDEPTASLDPESSRVVEDMAEELSREGTTVIMVNHGDYLPRTVKPVVLRVENGRAEVQS